MTEKCCMTCKFYAPINHRGQRYPKGKCKKHFASRLSDKYQIHLTISLPREYVCDLYEEKWSGIMREVDRLYHANTTSEGRVNCITDYIVRLINNYKEDAEP